MNSERARRIVLASLASLAVLGLLLFGFDPDAARPVPSADSVAAVVSAPSAQAPAATRRSVAPRHAYELQPGERLRLDVDLHLHMALTHGDAAPQELRGRIAGELELLVLARRGDELALRAVMPDARVEGGDGTAAVRQLREALRRGTVVRLSQRGRIHGYRFPDAMSPAQRNQFRTLFASLRASVGGPEQSQWTVVDADATGEAEYAGAWDAQQLGLTAHKRAYREREGALLPEVDGRGTATLDPMAAWWRRFDWQESSAVRVGEAGLVI